MIIGILTIFIYYIYSKYVYTESWISIPVEQHIDNDDRWQPVDTNAHIIFYRAGDSSSLEEKTLLNVYVNDQYPSIALPDFSIIKMELCPGQKKIEISAGNLKQVNTGAASIEEVSPILYPGEHYYYQVSLGKSGVIHTRWVSENEAEKVISRFITQKNFSSRVLNEKDCSEVIYSISKKHDIHSMQANRSEDK